MSLWSHNQYIETKFWFGDYVLWFLRVITTHSPKFQRRWSKLYSWCKHTMIVATPLWPSVRVKPNTPKVGDLESSGTLECLEFDNKAQNYSHWGVLGVIGKVLKRRYRKLAVWLSTTKSRESSSSRHPIWECDTSLERSRRGLQLWFRPRCNPTLQSGVMSSQSPGWRAPKSRGETHLRVSQNQVAESETWRHAPGF
jgi:hypothetical protein